MKNYSRHKILDNILLSLKNTTVDRPVEEGEIFFDMQIHKSTGNRDKLIVIEKLMKDGFINKTEMLVGAIKEKGFYITFEGLLHIEQGGYIGKLKREANQESLQSIEKGLIVLGVVVAALYYGIEIWKYFCGC